MIINIKIDTKDLSALSTLDYWCNNEDNFEFYNPEKKEYFENLEKKKSLKPGDHFYFTDFKSKWPDVVLTIEHGKFNTCIINGVTMPYSNIILI